MQKVLKLRQPLLVNGKNIKELKFDTEKITGELYLRAESFNQQQGIGHLAPYEFDPVFQFGLGCAAIIAENSEIDWADLKRVQGFDLIQITNIGRTFMSGSEESLQENNSEEPSETTQESTTPV